MKVRILLIILLFALPGLAGADDVLNDIKRQFPCGTNKFCITEDDDYDKPEIQYLKNGYKFVTLFYKTASGNMLLYEAFLKDQHGEFYDLGEIAGPCVDSENLLLIQAGHCSADKASFEVDKIDLENKKLVTIKSYTCSDGKEFGQFLQKTFSQGANSTCSQYFRTTL